VNNSPIRLFHVNGFDFLKLRFFVRQCVFFAEESLEETVSVPMFILLLCSAVLDRVISLQLLVFSAVLDLSLISLCLAYAFIMNC